MLKKSITCKFSAIFAALTAVVFLTTAVSAIAYSDSEVVGTLPEKLYSTKGDTLEEMRNSSTISSPLGEATSDAAVIASGADFGYLCGGDMWANLLPGEITWGELVDAYTENRELAVATVTIAQLREMLEVPASKLTVGDDGLLDVEASASDSFPQLSGLKLTIDISAPLGERVRKLCLTDGTELDLDDAETEYTLVGTSFMFSGGYDMPEIDYEPLGITMADAMVSYINAGFESSYNSYTKLNRVVIQGAGEDTIYSKIPKGLLPAVIVIIVVCQIYRKKERIDPNDRSVDI